MKKRILVMLLLAPMLIFAQVKGKKSKKTFTTSSSTEFNVGDVVTLKNASNNDAYAYAYISKSALSLGNVMKAVKSVRNVKNLDVKNLDNISNTLDKVNNLANSELVNNAMSQLIGKAVSSKYVDENALNASLSGKRYKIKSFKIYTDKSSGNKIVHAIAKGNGQSVAILLDLAEKVGEI